MQKMTCALAGLAVAAGGVVLAGSPANAQATLAQGHRHRHHSVSSWSRSTNVNRNVNRNVVRVNVRNVNHNSTVIRDFDRERDNEFEGAGFFRRRCRFDCGFDRERIRDGRDDDEERGDRIVVGNDFGVGRDRG